MSDYTFDALVKKEKRTVIEDGKEVTKEVDVNYISSKIEDNLKSFYMFYTPLRVKVQQNIIIRNLLLLSWYLIRLI